MPEGIKKKKVANIIGDVFVAILMIISVLVTILTLSSIKSSSKMPNLFGRMLFSVQSDSMIPEFARGDLLVIQPYKNQDLEKNDIISFLTLKDRVVVVNTHRIVEVVKYDEDTVIYTTKGDNTPSRDLLQVSKGDIVGVYKFGSNDGTKVSGLGSVLDFLKSKNGFLFCIIVPLTFLFIFQLYRFLKTLMDSRAEKVKEEAKNLSEEEKQRVVEEYLRQQSLDKEKEQNNKKE